jgi:hypothetical protein
VVSLGVGFGVGLGVGGSADSGRNPWWAVPAATVATPTGTVVILEHHRGILPSSLPLMIPRRNPKFLELGGNNALCALGRMGLWVGVVLGGTRHCPVRVEGLHGRELVFYLSSVCVFV